MLKQVQHDWCGVCWFVFLVSLVTLNLFQGLIIVEAYNSPLVRCWNKFSITVVAFADLPFLSFLSPWIYFSEFLYGASVDYFKISNWQIPYRVRNDVCLSVIANEVKQSSSLIVGFKNPILVRCWNKFSMTGVAFADLSFLSLLSPWIYFRV